VNKLGEQELNIEKITNRKQPKPDLAITRPSLIKKLPVCVLLWFSSAKKTRKPFKIPQNLLLQLA